MINARNKAKSSTQSLINNFHSTSDHKFDGKKIKYYVKCLKQYTGSQEQFLIMELLKFGIANHPDYKQYVKKLEAAWKQLLIEEKKEEEMERVIEL